MTLGRSVSLHIPTIVIKDKINTCQCVKLLLAYRPFIYFYIKLDSWTITYHGFLMY